MKLATSLTVLLAAVAIGCMAPSFAQGVAVQTPDAGAQMADEPPSAEMMIMQGPGQEIAAGVPGAMPDLVLGVGEHGDAFHGLGLTDDQHEKLFELKRAQIGKNAATMGQLASAEFAMHDLLLQPTLDKAKIQAAENQINQLKAAMANSRLDMIVNEMSVLTPEQRETLRKRIVHEVVGAGPFGMGGHMGHHAMQHRHMQGHMGPHGPGMGGPHPGGPEGPHPGGPQ